MPFSHQSIQSEQTSQIFAALGNAILATLVNATILVVVQWQVIDHDILLIWFTSIALISLTRVLVAYRYKKTIPTPERSDLWSKFFLIGTLLASLAWGSASIFLFPEGDLARQVFLSFVVGGMAAGAVTSLSSIKVAIYAYLIITLIPLIFRFFFHQGELATAMGIMLSLHLVMMLAAASRSHSNIKQNIILHNAVTQREYSLQQSERRYHTLLETATDAFFLHDIQGKYIDINQQACDNLGYTRNELLNMTTTDIEVGSSLQVLKQRWPRLKKDEKLRIEAVHRRKDGSTFPVEVSLGSVQFNNERLFSAFARDVTERVKTEQALRTQAMVIDQIHDAVISTDLQGVITSWNKGAERLLGHKDKEVLSKHIAIVYPQEDRARLQNAVIAPLRTKGDHEREVRLLRKSGEVFYAQLSLSMLHDKAGNPIGIISYAMDITERKRAEQALTAARDAAERANRAKSEFLSRMSHELRTPMNAILGFGQLLEYNDTLSEEQQDSVQEILKAGQHLLELINEVLDLAKVESGRIDLSLEPVEADPIIESCLNLMGALADKRAIRLTRSGQRGAVVRADHTRFKQALLNLLSNAIKYNRQGGSVALKVQARNEAWVRISVTDSGRGIPPKRLPELFQPFNRLEAENSEIEGTGIGLTLTRRIVELMGGTVGVESTVGKGSTFWIELPTESLPRCDQNLAHEATSTTATALAADSDSGRQRVLYIEDNPANLKLVARILRRRPHIHLLTAHTPQLGIELAQAHRPDLILLDINLPGMDGYQVLDVIKADRRLRDTPVIAVTANAMPRDIERGKSAGFTDYFTKPLSLNRFNDVLDKLIDEQRAGSKLQ